MPELASRQPPRSLPRSTRPSDYVNAAACKQTALADPRYRLGPMDHGSPRRPRRATARSGRRAARRFLRGREVAQAAHATARIGARCADIGLAHALAML